MKQYKKKGCSLNTFKKEYKEKNNDDNNNNGE